MKQPRQKAPWVRHDPVFESDVLNPALATSPWSGHRRFAYDLIAFRRPRLIVELGTHYGCSFFAFLQSIKDLRLRTECRAVDNWKGDDHAGYYEEDVFEIVKRTVESYFSYDYADLVRSSFDDAIPSVEDCSIDILHIDGLHDYEAVGHDFETWLPKVARNGIVLFHDVDPSSGYGSAQFWSALKQHHPHLEFLHHSFGLGVLFPKGDLWHRRIRAAVPEEWLDLYRFQAEADLYHQQYSDAGKMLEERWLVLQQMEEAIRARDEAITDQRREVAEKSAAIETMETELAKRDEAIVSQRQEVEEKKAVIDGMAAEIAIRDARIEAAADELSATCETLEERSAAMRVVEHALAERESELERLSGEIAQRDALLETSRKLLSQAESLAEDRLAKLRARLDLLSDFSRRLGLREAMDVAGQGAGEAMPFQDLAYSFYLFTARLHEAVAARNVGDLYFFAREGKLLKEMFDCFQNAAAGRKQVRTHYLEVSRRATFLPSLGPLETEGFDVLFRQYRRISVEAFLKSLALEEHMPELARLLEVDLQTLRRPSDDLPSDPLFQRMIALEAFRVLYERERQARSAALADYLASFTGGSIPENLHVVDAGWKGSIQDNLFNWLTRVKGEKAAIHGFYIGLVAPGAMSARNGKTGLLFSNQGGGLTPGFRIFNENRSLFEILLPAEHGSVQRYVHLPEGCAVPLHDSFEERAMIEEHVAPVVARIMQLYERIVDAAAHIQGIAPEIATLVLKRHSRMVFRPTREEIGWMLTIFHVENFGTFGQSRFNDLQERQSLSERLRFTCRLLQERRPSEVGFWPWLTLTRRAVPGMGALYFGFRRLQEQMGQ